MRSQKIARYKLAISTDNKKSPLCIFLIICCAFLCPNFVALAETIDNSVLEPAPPALSRTKIYFYNPEINADRNVVLKSAWDSYLLEMGHYELQPVDNGESFTQLIQQEQDTAFIMSEWLFSSLSSVPDLDKKNLELTFIGMKNGSDTYRKVLVAHKSALNLENVTIASSGSKERALKLLSSIYPELSPDKLGNLKILLVPKDIDALMAVGYGLAEMALTTEVSLSKIADLNENLHKDMLVLRKSEPFKRSVLIFKSNNFELKAALFKTLNNMGQNRNGKQAMSLLGLDEWRVVDKTMAQIPAALLNTMNDDGGAE